MSTVPADAPRLVFCIPVYNDWVAVAMLLEQLDGVAGELDSVVDVLLVDDGSTERPPQELAFTPVQIARVDVLPLRRNLGHQRAIALGLTFIYVNRPCAAVVVMDADGEDAPRDVPTLLFELKKHHGQVAVFAARSRRTEGLVFRTGYVAYKLFHRLLTGRSVEVGNFSILPWGLLERLVGVSEIWNHYAAAAYKARLPVVQVPIPRSARLAGASRMGLVALMIHGLSAISVYGEIVGVRLVCLAAVLMAIAFGGIVVAFGIDLSSGLAIPSWATAAAAILGVLLASLFMMLTVSILFVLQSRDRYSFLPLRDYAHYILPPVTLHG